ncbi:hypothetical protein ACTXG6_23815 [Pseudonocardia sp. Cha107L01]|uniref:hypothetical protein n=1 Tax=Pseudonocardia sp. Cha107L01 TaxID=3457576 RepID=UPI00403E7535
MFYGELLDAELSDRSREETRIAASLVELERHPGHRLLTGGPLTGATAARWATAAPLLSGLWRDFALYRDALDTARRVRGSRPRPNETALAELHRVLALPSVEVSRTEVGLSERGLTGAAERVEKITLDELSTRMHAAFAEVSELVTTCGRLREEALAELAPIAERVRAAGRLVAELDVGQPSLTAAASALADLERRAGADPLSLADGSGGLGRELPALSVALDDLTTRLTAIASVRDGWADRLAELDGQLRRLDELRARERTERDRATELVAASLTAPPDRLPDLLSRRAGLERAASWAARADTLGELRTTVGAAAAELGAAVELATGLVERRAELRGRFEAYRARALRLGRIEEPGLMRLEEEIRRLLWTRPAELAGATRAIGAYQRLLRQASDAGRSA